MEESVDSGAFISPEDYPFDKYSEGVYVYTFAANSISTLDEVVERLIEQRKTDLVNSTLLELKNGSSLAAHPSKVFIYT